MIHSSGIASARGTAVRPSLSSDFWLYVGLPSLFIGAQVLIHLINGSDLVCVTLMGLTLAIGVVILNTGGLRDTIGLISMIYIAKYVGVASPVKIFLGQTLESNLSHPRDAFLMTFLSTVELYAAYRLTSRYHFRLVLLKEKPYRQYLKALFWVAYPLGALSFLIGACIPSYASTAGEGFQTFMLPILIAAVVARTAYVISDPSGSRELDGPLVFMIGSSFFLAFIANLKFVAVIMITAYAVTIVVRKGSASLKLILLGGGGLGLALVVIFPLINLMRASNSSSFGGRSMKERTIVEKLDSIKVFFETQELSAYLESYEDGARQASSHYPYFGNTGIWPAGWAFQHAVPRVLNGEKTQDAMCDMMFAHAGILPKGFKNDLTLGMVAGSYVMYGWSGVVTIPFILFTCFFLQQRLWAGNSTTNLWAIVLLVDFFNAFTEAEPSFFIEHLIREFPLHFLALYVTHQVACVALRLFPGRQPALTR
jgi:hypothetical protein